MTAEAETRAEGRLDAAVEHTAKLVGSLRGLIAAAVVLLVAGAAFAIKADQLVTKTDLSSAIDAHAIASHPEIARQIEAIRVEQAGLRQQIAVESAHREYAHEALNRLLDAQGIPHPPAPKSAIVGPAPAR